MQTRNPFLDEFAKLTTGAMGLAQAAGEEAKTAFRAQADRFVADMDLVRRDEHDALKAEVAALRAELAALMEEFQPHAVSVEHVFFQVNVRTAMSVGQASGLALAEAASRGCEVAQYTPNQVKDAVAGYGGAGKEQVGHMVQTLLGLAAPPKPADAADAAALALCHLAHAPMRAKVRA